MKSPFSFMVGCLPFNKEGLCHGLTKKERGGACFFWFKGVSKDNLPC